ncbi:MAG: DUF3107 domain-containing protein [Propionibacteriaceae bacterium]|jgi:hypothetical protein|nr:DUF3107 domain-containing protein [Propionibacteriaceae bacterium]
MEIKIGIRNVAREVTLNVDLTIADVVKAYEQARKADTLFTLDDASGRHMVIPPETIGYLEFGQEHARPVGFGA